MTASAARLTELLTPVVAETGADLEEVTVSRAGRRSVVRIAVDRDGGIDLDHVADISRVVSEALDQLDEQDPSALGDSYVLEVGSPGVDRPLTEPRHWRRNVKRLVTATLADGSTVTGRLGDADEQRVVLDGREIPYADLVKGTVQVEFARKDEEDDA